VAARSRCVRATTVVNTAMLLVLCLILLGCDTVFVPLGRPGTVAVPQDVVTEMPLRLAIGREAECLAQDLLPVYASRYPDITIMPLTMSGSSALQALADGKADVALVAARDASELYERTGALVVTPVARSGLAIITHRNVTVAQISAEDLRALFSGDISDWSALGAPAGQPQLAVQAPGTPARDVFDASVMAGARVSSTARVLPNDSALAEFVAAEPLAIGYAAAACLPEEAPVSVLALDLLLPTRANIEKGQYPLSYGLYLVVADGAHAEASAFVAFATSSRGREAVRARHALP